MPSCVVGCLLYQMLRSIIAISGWRPMPFPHALADYVLQARVARLPSPAPPESSAD